MLMIIVAGMQVYGRPSDPAVAALHAAAYADPAAAGRSRATGAARATRPAAAAVVRPHTLYLA